MNDPLAAAIPAELQDRPQWVVWRYVQHKGRPKPAKMPYTIFGTAAKTDDPGTWTTFANVLSAYRRDLGLHLAGIGFVFSRSDPFVGIDLDNCISAEGEELPWGLEFLAALRSYAEFSPSGRGVKTIVRGQLPGEGTGLRVGGFGPDKAGAVEMYAWGRFFALTGQIHPDATPTIEDRSAAVADVYACLRGEQRRRQDGQSAASPPATAPHAPPAAASGPVSDADAETRCLAYLSRCPDSISGQGGHAKCFRAAAETVRFGLSEAAAWRVMRWWSDHKSGGEPWSDREIAHKLRSAAKFVGADRGKRLRETRTVQHAR